MPGVHPIALAAAGLAALVHVWIFVLESLRFHRPEVWRRFGMRSEADAAITRGFAFNQGFYNLFLAGGAIAGIVMVQVGNAVAGRAVLLFVCASMVLAGVVLVAYDRRFVRAAAIQAGPPLVAGLALLFLG